MIHILFIYLLILPSLVSARPGYHEPWGRDSDLYHVVAYSSPLLSSTSPSVLVSVASHIIHFHQHVLSPVDGPRSHFHPSSSGYMLQALHKHGFFKGFLMGCDRLLRENSDDWCYRTIQVNGKIYKYDPVP